MSYSRCLQMLTNVFKEIAVKQQFVLPIRTVRVASILTFMATLILSKNITRLYIVCQQVILPIRTVRVASSLTFMATLISQ